MPNKAYLRFFVRVTRVSQPFNAGQVVEVKFEMDHVGLHAGAGAELHFRVPVEHKEHYHVGDEYAIRLYKVA